MRGPTEAYYDSDDGFKFYNIINGSDYSGMGRYPEAAESRFEDGTSYVIGAGATVFEATRMRDNYVLDKILRNLPDSL